MAQFFEISTDGVPPRERYSFWTEAYSRKLVGMSTDHGTVRPETFSARVRATMAGQAARLDIGRSPGVTRRTETDIGNMPMGSLLIYRSPSARTWFRSGSREFVAPAGSLVIGMSDVPWDTAPTDGMPYDCTLVRLPFGLIEARHGALRSHRPIIATVETGFGALFESYLSSWNAQLAHLTDPQAEVANLALANMAAVAFGMADIRHEAARDAIRRGRIDAALRYIAGNLQRFDLSPDKVAAHVGVSTRQLHLDFEPTGASVSRRILEMRLERAARMLSAETTRSIADIAYSCGFDGLSTFYRVFKARYGMTASDLRAMSNRRE